jgi:hypothetical protein
VSHLRAKFHAIYATGGRRKEMRPRSPKLAYAPSLGIDWTRMREWRMRSKSSGVSKH